MERKISAPKITFSKEKEDNKVVLKKQNSGKDRRRLYSVNSKKKILSVIQEEHKFLTEYIPSQDIEASPYFRNCVFQDKSSHQLTFPSIWDDSKESAGKERENATSLIFYENKHPQSVDEDKLRYLKRMLRQNSILLEELSKKQSTKRKINWGVLDKSRNFFLLLNQRKQGKVLSYTEQQFQIMLANMNKEQLIRLVEANIKFFENELTLAQNEIKTQKILNEANAVGQTNSNRDEYSPSKYTSEYSDSEYS